MNEAITRKEIGISCTLSTHYILLKAIKFPEKTKSGLLTPDSYRKLESKLQNYGFVLDIGPTAYLPRERFGGFPSCKIGDWVTYSHYDRVELPIPKTETMCYIIPDDRVLGVVEDINDVIPDLEAVWGIKL
jgi:co-chaperonin GroES (HSP10)